MKKRICILITLILITILTIVFFIIKNKENYIIKVEKIENADKIEKIFDKNGYTLATYGVNLFYKTSKNTIPLIDVIMNKTIDTKDLLNQMTTKENGIYKYNGKGTLGKEKFTIVTCDNKTFIFSIYDYPFKGCN